MRAQEIKNYKALNKLAEQNGIVIFGEKEDVSIPLCELRQAFGIKENCYNRSFENLTISAPNSGQIISCCYNNFTVGEGLDSAITHGNA